MLPVIPPDVYFATAVFAHGDKYGVACLHRNTMSNGWAVEWVKAGHGDIEKAIDFAIEYLKWGALKGVLILPSGVKEPPLSKWLVGCINGENPHLEDETLQISTWALYTALGAYCTLLDHPYTESQKST